jgi:hypothetical protein
MVQTSRFQSPETPGAASESAARPGSGFTGGIPLIGLCLGLLLCVGVSWIGNDRFPVFFIADESNPVNYAEALLKNGFRDESGTFLPTFFRNGDRYCVGTTIYLHVPVVFLFGKSVALSRGTLAFVSLLAPLSAALLLRRMGLRHYWMAPLLFAAVPCWFLHTRTALEYPPMVAFYAASLSSYLAYREGRPFLLVPATFFAGLAFYTYTNGQGLVVLTVAALLVLDARHHVKQPPKALLASLVVGLLLCVPYARYRQDHRSDTTEQLRKVGSFLSTDAPAPQKGAAFLRNYRLAFDPRFWFGRSGELDRASPASTEGHRLKGLGHLPLFLAPFLLVGLLVSARRAFQGSPGHRLLVLALLAAPFTAALAYVNVNRALAMVFPAVALSCVGFEALVGRLPSAARRAASLAAALGLVGCAAWMLGRSLAEGPLWPSDYGISGQQYGARQIYGEIRRLLASAPDRHFYVSPDWAIETESFVSFFLPERQRSNVHVYGLLPKLVGASPLPRRATFVLMASEMKDALATGKVRFDPPELVVTLPNGEPGFYFTKLAYVENVQEIVARQREERRRLVEEPASIDGEQVVVRHSRIDSGGVAELFDRNRETVARGEEANPFVVDLEFGKPRRIGAVAVDVWHRSTEIRLVGTLTNGEAREATFKFRDREWQPHNTMTVPEGFWEVTRLRIEIKDLDAGETAKVHVQGISF